MRYLSWFFLSCALLAPAVAPAEDADDGVLDDYLGEYRVTEATYGSPPCPLQRVSIFRGERFAREGVFLEANGRASLPDGSACEATLGVLLSTNDGSARCRAHANAVTCLNTETGARVLLELLGDDNLLVQLRARRLTNAGASSFYLKRVADPR